MRFREESIFYRDAYQDTWFHALRFICFLPVSNCLLLAAFILFSSSQSQAAIQTDIEINQLGMEIADYRVPPDEAANMLIDYMRSHPDHRVTHSIRGHLDIMSATSVDIQKALANAICEARKETYSYTGQPIDLDSGRVFDKVEQELVIYWRGQMVRKLAWGGIALSAVFALFNLWRRRARFQRKPHLQRI